MNYKAEVVRYAKLLEEKGLVNALEGNISMYDRDADRLYITPSGKRKLFLDEDMIAVVDCDGNQLEGSLRRSSEYLLHQAVYQARPEFKGVIHCHAPYLTAYACCNMPVQIDYYPEFLTMFREIPVIPFGMPGTHEIHQGIAQALEKSRIVLLGNHGVVCGDEDLELASKFLEAAEASAKVAAITRALGTPAPLPEGAVEACRSMYR